MTPREQLEAALRAGRLGHCYLLCGARNRSEEVARGVAEAYLCLAGGSDRPDAARPCGTCASCRAARQHTHPDLRRWEAERGAWRIEQVRALIGEAFRRPTLGERRVHILVDVHLLTLPSANALLKLLEEPPPGTLFLLLADQVADLPATLLSRCQLLAWPQEDAGRAGASLAEEILEATGRGKGSHLLLLAKRLTDRGEEVTGELTAVMRDRVVRMVREGQDADATRALLRAWEAVERAATRLEAHGNARLVWECLLLELADVFAACPCRARGL